MNTTLYKGAVEAVLFAVAEPVGADRIAEAIGQDKTVVLSLLKSIKAELDDRESGISLMQFEDRYQLCTRPVNADFVTRALDTRRNTPLTQASLEVLAIIAYNQPVSRSYIDQIRGVDCSSSVNNLISKGLVVEAGRLDLPGRPVSFKTTDTFLRCFGLQSLEDLPSITGEVGLLDEDAIYDGDDPDLER